MKNKTTEPTSQNLNLNNMKSKDLQSNHTTKEQSKYLLELGLPADSADCYHGNSKDNIILVFNGKFPKSFAFAAGCIPCWSVGRLIEIYTIARDADFVEFDVYANNPCILNELLKRIEDNINKLNFSKLEEWL